MERNESGKYVIGVDLGGTTVSCAVVDKEGHMLSREELPSLAEKGIEVTTDQISFCISKAIDSANCTREDIIACGMGAPGLHEPKEGVVLWSPNFNGWDGANVYQPLNKKTGYKFYMGNDANVATYGEYFFGVGKNSKVMVMFTLGTGIGSGLIVNGKPYNGVFGASPELGHTIIMADGPRCGCGRRGCVESLCSRDAICNRCASKIGSGRKSLIYEMCEGNLQNITPKMISTAAENNDLVSIETLEEIGHLLGITCANAINTFNPDLLVLGGGVSRSDILFEFIKKTTFEVANDTLKQYCEIKRSELGNDAGILGGAALAWNDNYA
ncbi:MAG: ROK family protein [Abditibacteriota bacterium]|nr:ROK family protein [Abditibacteriota bacterium]